MTLSPNKMAIAIAGTFSLFWVACSMVIALLPSHSMALTGSMFHADLSAVTWTLTWTGFFIGLASWAILGGITAWLVAFIYNRITHP